MAPRRPPPNRRASVNGNVVRTKPLITSGGGLLERCVVVGAVAIIYLYLNALLPAPSLRPRGVAFLITQSASQMNWRPAFVILCKTFASCQFFSSLVPKLLFGNAWFSKLRFGPWP